MEQFDASKDYYAILGISKDAEPEIIKAVFRALSRKYHPDINPGDKAAEEKFKEVNTAHNVLIDPESKRAYDSARQYYAGQETAKEETFRKNVAQQDPNGWGSAENDFGDFYGESSLSKYDALKREMFNYNWHYFQMRPVPMSDELQVDFYVTQYGTGYEQTMGFNILRESLRMYGAENITDADHFASRFTTHGSFAFTITKKTSPELVRDLERIINGRQEKLFHRKVDDGHKYFTTKISMVAGLCPLNMLRQNAELLGQLRNDSLECESWKIVRSKQGAEFIALDVKSASELPMFKGIFNPEEGCRNYFKFIMQLHNVSYETSPEGDFLIIPNQRSVNILAKNEMVPEEVLKHVHKQSRPGEKQTILLGWKGSLPGSSSAALG